MVQEVRRARLGEALVQSGVITADQLELALQEQREFYRPLGEVLLSLGFARSDEIGAALAQHMGIPFVRAAEIEPDPVLTAVIDTEFVRAAGAFPIRMRDGVLEAAFVDPSDPARVALVRERFRAPVDLLLITADDLEKLAVRLLAPGQSSLQRELAGIAALAGDYPVEEVVQALFEDAVESGATDLHLEPEEELTRVRYRVDGVLQAAEALPAAPTRAIVSRIKILSGLDIAESRRPQDGRLRARVRDHDVHMRVSTMPCAHGENVVLRILDGSSGGVRLTDLGVSGSMLRVLRAIPQRSHGLFLVTGPTGSGKSTTLYAMLGEVDAIHRKVVTIENPIEYSMPLIRQSQVDSAVGYGFHQGLRAILRQDPDVILVGEIRDQETADMAIKASMTGHLVFATLHTNTAVGALSRLADLGIPPYLVRDSLVGVLAQRLVRKVCGGCAQPVEVAGNEALRAALGDRPGAPRSGSGCEACRGSGYAGRTVIGELFLPTPALLAAAGNTLDPARIEAALDRSVFRSIYEDGLDKVRLGITTLEEVDRVGRGHQLSEEEIGQL